MGTYRKSGRAGVTLMEMMIALLVGAIVVTPLYIVTRGMAQQSDAQRMDIETMQRARLGLATLSKDFGRAGLYASPNTLQDPKYANRDISSSSSWLAFRTCTSSWDASTDRDLKEEIFRSISAPDVCMARLRSIEESTAAVLEEV